ncbi:MAG: histidine phosphatase family protein [Lachnospiraceae bacterium]|nr:histidine phosphatase family protein [Lachnospiraceae bacterium]
MKLYFIRHGEPDYEHDCLTPNGRRQAQCTAQKLKGAGIDEIYASPMGRAVETASYTAKEYGYNITKLDFMHEINWGDDKGEIPYGGHPWSLSYRLLTEAPEYLRSDDWDEHHYFRNNKCLEYYGRISEEFDGFMAGFGYERKDGLYICHEPNEKKIALFAHGGSGAVMFSHVLNLTFPFVLAVMPYGVCSISVIDFASHPGELIVPRLALFNEMGHIESFKTEKLTFDK